jgi:hypothetical protein
MFGKKAHEFEQVMRLPFSFNPCQSPLIVRPDWLRASILGPTFKLMFDWIAARLARLRTATRAGYGSDNLFVSVLARHEGSIIHQSPKEAF